MSESGPGLYGSGLYGTAVYGPSDLPAPPKPVLPKPPRLPNISVVIEGREVPIDQDYSFTTNTLGYDLANITIPEAYARMDGVEQGALLTAFDNSGAVRWEGRIAQRPHAMDGKAQVKAGGHQVQLRKQTGRYTLQIRGYSEWVDGSDDPHEYASADSLDQEVRKGALNWKAPKGTDVVTGDTSPLLIWLEGDKVRRVAFTVRAKSTYTATQFRLQRATGPSGARTNIGTDRDIVPNNNEDINILEANAQDQFLINCVRTGSTTTLSSTQWWRAVNMRVWGNRTQADTFSIQQSLQNISGDLGYDSSGVSSNLSRNVLPLDWTDGSWDGLFEYLLMLQDGYARVLENRGSGPYLEANTWANSQVYDATRYDSATTPVALYNKVVVKFRNQAGRLRQRTATASVPELDSRGLVNVYPEGEPLQLEDPQPDGTLAQNLADATVARVSQPQEVGTIMLYESRSPTGDRNPYAILPGDKLRIPDHDLGSDFTHRVVGTTLTREGMAVEVGEPPLPEERMLALHGLRRARRRQRRKPKRRRR